MNISACSLNSHTHVQTLVDGFQHEQPDYWLNFGNPWEIERLNVGYTIKFYGYVSASEENGRQTFEWIPGDSVRPTTCFVLLTCSKTCASTSPQDC